MGLLAAGAGLYMLAMACAQAVIALGGHGDQAIGWAIGLIVLALTVVRWRATTCSCGSSSALLVGSVVALVVIGGLLLRRAAAVGPVDVDSGDLIEAIHDVADRALTASLAACRAGRSGLVRLLSQPR